MRVIAATLPRLALTALAAAGLACKRAPRANPPPADAGTVVSVYLPPKTVERLMGRLQVVAAQHQWVLSIRTDAEALTDADLVVVDSAGVLRGRVREGSPAAVQAKQMADLVLR